MARLSRQVLPVLIATLLLMAATTASAQAWPYVSGTAGFHFQQFPFGAYSGDFAATGAMPDGALDQAVGGLYTTSRDTTTAFWFAAVAQPDTTVDLALLWVRRPGAILSPGDYPIDVIGRTVLFAFADNISDFTLPADPGNFDPSAWLGSLTCDHLFVAMTGTVHLGSVGPLEMSGTFAGAAADDSPMIISITGGHFALDGLDVAVENMNWGDVKAAFR